MRTCPASIDLAARAGAVPSCAAAAMGVGLSATAWIVTVVVAAGRS
jgi:hypothetical protein